MADRASQPAAGDRARALRRAGHARRRARRPGTGGLVATRAGAHRPGGDRAQRRAPRGAAALRSSSARSSRPTATGTGCGLAARPRARPAPTWLAVATAREAVGAARVRRSTGGCCVLGALAEPTSCRARSARMRTSRSGTRTSRRCCPTSARVHVKLDTGLGRLGTRDPREATAIAEALAARGDARRRSGRTSRPPTSSATTSSASSSAASATGRCRCAQRHPGRAAARRQQRGDAARPRQPLRHGALRRRRSTGSTRSAQDPFAQGLEPALSLRSYVAAVKVAPAGRVDRATGAASSRASRRRSRRSRSATATACAAGCRATAEVLDRRAAARAARDGLDGQHHGAGRRLLRSATRSC